MARILRTDVYPFKNPISLNDYVIGTDSENSNRTKNFRVGDFVGFIETIGLPNGQFKGEIVLDQNLRFLYTEIENVIDNAIYNVPPGAITGINSDPTNPRIDVIQADASGNVSVIQGIASANPVEPIVADPLSAVKLTSYRVNPLATTPFGITKTLMYDEDTGILGGEYDVTATVTGSGVINLANPTNPNTGTVSISVLNTANTGDFITMSPELPETIQSFTNIHFYLNNTVQWSDASRIKIVFYNEGVPVSSEVSVRNGQYGLVSTLLNQYQSIIIPKDDFEFRGNTYDEIQFQFENLPQGVLYLDTFNILGGIENIPRFGTVKSLRDAPKSYVGKAGYSMVVNQSESGFELVEVGGVSNDSPFEAINEGSGIGIIRRGRTAANYGPVGEFAYDFSFNTITSTTFGATGDYSFLFGVESTASGFGSGGNGFRLDLRGTYTHGWGFDIIANGYSSLLAGSFLRETTTTGYNLIVGQGHVYNGNSGGAVGAALLQNSSVGCVVVGAANIDLGGTNNGSDLTNPVFIVGGGTHTTPVGAQWTAIKRENIFVIRKNGEVTVPFTSPSIIAAESTGRIVVTREYIEQVVKPYKVYVALLSQVGAGDPTAIVLQNTLGETLSFSRTAPGTYTCTASGAVFTNNKTSIQIQPTVNANDGTPSVVNTRPSTTTSFTIWTSDIDNAGTVYNDDALTNSAIEIRVYD